MTILKDKKQMKLDCSNQSDDFCLQYPYCKGCPYDWSGL